VYGNKVRIQMSKFNIQTKSGVVAAVLLGAS